MTDLAAGDFVVALYTATDGKVAIEKRRLYRVAEIMIGRSTPHACTSGFGCDAPGIRLIFPQMRNPRDWWCSTYFSRVHRPKAGAFDYLLERPYNYDTILREIQRERDEDSNGPPPKKPKAPPPKGMLRSEG